MIYTKNPSASLQAQELELYRLAQEWATRCDDFLAVIASQGTQAGYAMGELLSRVSAAQDEFKAVRDTSGIRNHFIGVESDVDYDVVAEINSVLDKLDDVATAASQVIVESGVVKTEEWIDGKMYPVVKTSNDMAPLVTPLTELRALVATR